MMQVRPILIAGVVLALAVGWLVGLAGHWTTIATTGYGDVLPAQMLLGILLCAGAGAAARIVPERPSRIRRGVVAGILMAGSIIAATLALDLAFVVPNVPADNGETWLSLLLEAPFWIGVPLLVSAAAGGIGWALVDLVAGHRRTADRRG